MTKKHRPIGPYEIPDKGPIPAKAGPKLPVFRQPYKPDLAARRTFERCQQPPLMSMASSLPDWAEAKRKGMKK